MWNFHTEKEVKKQDNEEKLNNLSEKAIHRQNVRQIENKDKSTTWKGLRKSNLNGCTEVLIFIPQEDALRTSYVKFHIDKTVVK